MKATVSIFLLLVSVVYAGQIHYAEKYLDQIATSKSECFKKENVDEKYLTKVNDSDLPPFEELGCYTLCMINKFKLTDGELRFQTDVYKKYIDDLEMWEKVEAALAKCLPKDKKIRSCEDAYDLQNCLQSNV